LYRKDVFMNKTIFPQDQSFWYLNRPRCVSLQESLQADVVVVGGGMAGLTAAQSFMQKNKKVILLEAYYCGAGASGKSSGFITPNCELSLAIFVQRYGKQAAQHIWHAVEQGVQHIRNNIEQYKLACDYSPEDTLVVANSPKELKELIQEHECLTQFGYASNYIQKEDLSRLIGSKEYYGGVTYEHTFGINGYKYCQEMKKVLSEHGVQIYEETPVLAIEEHTVITKQARVKADIIVVCTDQFTPQLQRLTAQVYHAQTFLLISQVLRAEEKQQIFPNNNLMVWDTDLIYTYFRIANQRLLLGGGSLLNTYDAKAQHNSTFIYNKLTNYFKYKFPTLELQFEQFWPGLIGLSKDVAPIAGPDKTHDYIYYIAASAGLSIAAGMGMYCADYYCDKRDDLKDYFSPYRSSAIPDWAQKILGKKISFALANTLSR